MLQPSRVAGETRNLLTALSRYNSGGGFIGRNGGVVAERRGRRGAGCGVFRACPRVLGDFSSPHEIFLRSLLLSNLEFSHAKV